MEFQELCEDRKERRKMVSHSIEHGRMGEKSGMFRELGVVFNEVDGSVPQIALNCQPCNLSHPT